LAFWQQFVRRIRNIESGQRWACENKSNSKEIAKICSNFAWIGSILNQRLHPLRNIEWLEEALVAARKINNQNAEGAHMGNLGQAYSHLGETRKAIEYYEQSLKILREIRDRRGEGNHLRADGEPPCRDRPQSPGRVDGLVQSQAILLSPRLASSSS